MAFLRSVKSDRQASMGSLDRSFCEKAKRRQVREDRERARREQLLPDNDIVASGPSHEFAESDFEEPTEDGDDDIDVSVHRSHHRVVRTGTTIFIPHDILSHPKMVEMNARLQITPTQQAGFLETLLEATGGDATKIALSYATADRARRTVS